MLCAQLFRAPKNQDGKRRLITLVKKIVKSCVSFCPPSCAKKPNLSFFRMLKEKCRRDSWLRDMLKDMLTKKREWRENPMTSK